MSKVHVSDLASILKFLDENFLQEEQFSEICDLDINNIDSQRLIIHRVLLPGFDEMNAKTQEHMVISLHEIVNNKLDCASVFEMITSPFDFSTVDHLGFVNMICEEIDKRQLDIF